MPVRYGRRVSASVCERREGFAILVRLIEYPIPKECRNANPDGNQVFVEIEFETE